MGPPLVPILSQIHTVHMLLLCFPKIHSNLRLHVKFYNKAVFYSEELLAPCPTSKLEDFLLSAVCSCLFNIFAATLHILRLSPLSTTQGHAMLGWQTHIICHLNSHICLCGNHFDRNNINRISLTWNCSHTLNVTSFAAS
jgi:hypothetical protein